MKLSISLGLTALSLLNKNRFEAFQRLRALFRSWCKLWTLAIKMHIHNTHNFLSNFMGFTDTMKFPGSEGEMSKNSRFLSYLELVTHCHITTSKLGSLTQQTSVSAGQESWNNLAGWLWFRLSHGAVVKTSAGATVIWRLGWGPSVLMLPTGSPESEWDTAKRNPLCLLWPTLRITLCHIHFVLVSGSVLLGPTHTQGTGELNSTS